MGSKFCGKSHAVGEAIVRDAKGSDLPALLEIYNDAVLMSPATFDLEPQTEPEPEATGETEQPDNEME